MDDQHSYEELQQRIFELQRELEETRNDAAEKKADRNRIIGSIAHEFNNILMGIQGNLSLIFLDISFSDKFFNKLKDIEKNVEGGVKLTEKLLDFITDGTYEPDMKYREMPTDNYNRLRFEINRNLDTQMIRNTYGSMGNQALRVYEQVYTGSNTILLVDDDAMILDVGKQMMERTGLEVVTAKSGPKAIEIYKKDYKKIDLVILDLMMPEINGVDTYYELRKINPDIKALFSSGYRKNMDINTIIEGGRSAFIQKPFKMEQLTQEIGKLLEL
jgi:CheY-like chemotaxis protein